MNLLPSRAMPRSPSGAGATCLVGLLLGALPAGAVPAGELEDAFEVAAIARAGLPSGAEIDVADLRPADPAMMAGAHHVRSVELPRGAAGTGLVTGRAHVELADGRDAWTWVTARVAARVPTTVAARDLRRGQLIEAGDVQLAFANVDPNHALDPSLAVGQRLGRGLVAGDAVLSRWLTAPSVVSRGDALSLVVRSGGVQVRARAAALEPGAVGDSIRVRVDGSSRVVHGTITAAGHVEVIL